MLLLGLLRLLLPLLLSPTSLILILILAQLLADVRRRWLTGGRLRRRWCWGRLGTGTGTGLRTGAGTGIAGTGIARTGAGIAGAGAGIARGRNDAGAGRARTGPVDFMGTGGWGAGTGTAGTRGRTWRRRRWRTWWRTGTGITGTWVTGAGVARAGVTTATTTTTGVIGIEDAAQLFLLFASLLQFGGGVLAAAAARPWPQWAIILISFEEILVSQQQISGHLVGVKVD